MKKIDLTGETFGKLFVVRDVGKTKFGQYLWLCDCDCGNQTTVHSSNLTKGHTKSCGCLKKEGTQSITHGQTNTSLYNTWAGMKKRATGKGGIETERKYKGVTICNEWKDFATFYDWAKDKYSPGLQIDRKNTMKGYSPDNCRFVTQKVNMQNRKDGKLWVINGIIFNSCSEAANVIGCSISTIKRRCDGRIDRGKHYPSFPNHYSINKYESESLCQ